VLVFVLVVSGCTGAPPDETRPVDGGASPGGLAGDHAGAGTDSSSTAQPGSPTAPRLTRLISVRLSRQLASGQIGQLRQALVVPTGQRLDPRAAAELNALGRVTFRVATFARQGPKQATVVGLVPAAPQGVRVWRFNLVFTGGRWRLADAEPVR